METKKGGARRGRRFETGVRADRDERDRGEEGTRKVSDPCSTGLETCAKCTNLSSVLKWREGRRADEGKNEG